MTGKYQKIKVQNEREGEQRKIRDRNEKQALIDRQLTQLQNLQDQMRPIQRQHKKLIIQLKKDIAQYMGMGDPGKKVLREKLNKMDRKEQRQIYRNCDLEYAQEM